MSETGFVDKINLAVMYSNALGNYAWRKNSEARTILRVLREVCPWLRRYKIHKDGNDKRWEASDDLAADSRIVFTDYHHAVLEVRDWILAALTTEDWRYPEPGERPHDNPTQV